MQKKILSAVLALCFVASASVAFAGGNHRYWHPNVDVDVDIYKVEDNIKMDDDNDGNINVTGEGVQGRNILLQGGANDANTSGAYNYDDFYASKPGYVNAGNVANQTNFDGGFSAESLSTSAVGNLSIRDSSRGNHR